MQGLIVQLNRSFPGSSADSQSQIQFQSWIWSAPASQYNIAEFLHSFPPKIHESSPFKLWYVRIGDGKMHLCRYDKYYKENGLEQLQVELDKCRIEVQRYPNKGPWFRKAPLVLSNDTHNLMYDESKNILFLRDAMQKEQMYTCVQANKLNITKQIQFLRSDYQRFVKGITKRNEQLGVFQDIVPDQPYKEPQVQEQDQQHHHNLPHPHIKAPKPRQYLQQKQEKKNRKGQFYSYHQQFKQDNSENRSDLSSSRPQSQTSNQQYQQQLQQFQNGNLRDSDIHSNLDNRISIDTQNELNGNPDVSFGGNRKNNEDNQVNKKRIQSQPLISEGQLSQQQNNQQTEKDASELTPRIKDTKLKVQLLNQDKIINQNEYPLSPEDLMENPWMYRDLQRALSDPIQLIDSQNQENQNLQTYPKSPLKRSKSNLSSEALPFANQHKSPMFQDDAKSDRDTQICGSDVPNTEGFDQGVAIQGKLSKNNRQKSKSSSHVCLDFEADRSTKADNQIDNGGLAKVKSISMNDLENIRDSDNIKVQDGRKTSPLKENRAQDIDENQLQGDFNQFDNLTPFAKNQGSLNNLQSLTSNQDINYPTGRHSQSDVYNLNYRARMEASQNYNRSKTPNLQSRRSAKQELKHKQSNFQSKSDNRKVSSRKDSQNQGLNKTKSQADLNQLQQEQQAGKKPNFEGYQLQEMPGVYGFNMVAGRIFYDFLRNQRFIDMIEKQVQKRLDNIQRPSYLAPFKLSNIDVGQTFPYVSNFYGLGSNSEHDFPFCVADMSYDGLIKMTVETILLYKETPLVGQGSEGNISQDVITQQDIENMGVDINQGHMVTLQPDQAQEQIISASRERNLTLENEDKSNADNQSQTQLSSNNSFTQNQQTYQQQESNDINQQQQQQQKKGIVGRMLQYAAGTTKYLVKKVASRYRNIPIKIEILIRKLDGQVLIWLPPPPSDRIWMSFLEPPNLKLDVNTELVSRVFLKSYIINKASSWIESKFKRAISINMVYPQCVDVRIPWLFNIDTFTENLEVQSKYNEFAKVAKEQQNKQDRPLVQESNIQNSTEQQVKKKEGIITQDREQGGENTGLAKGQKGDGNFGLEMNQIEYGKLRNHNQHHLPPIHKQWGESDTTQQHSSHKNQGNQKGAQKHLGPSENSKRHAEDQRSHTSNQLEGQAGDQNTKASREMQYRQMQQQQALPQQQKQQYQSKQQQQYEQQQGKNEADKGQDQMPGQKKKRWNFNIRPFPGWGRNKNQGSTTNNEDYAQQQAQLQYGRHDSQSIQGRGSKNMSSKGSASSFPEIPRQSQDYPVNPYFTEQQANKNVGKPQSQQSNNYLQKQSNSHDNDGLLKQLPNSNNAFTNNMGINNTTQDDVTGSGNNTASSSPQGQGDEVGELLSNSFNRPENVGQSSYRSLRSRNVDIHNLKYNKSQDEYFLSDQSTDFSIPRSPHNNGQTDNDLDSISNTQPLIDQQSSPRNDNQAGTQFGDSIRTGRSSTPNSIISDQQLNQNNNSSKQQSIQGSDSAKSYRQFYKNRNKSQDQGYFQDLSTSQAQEQGLGPQEMDLLGIEQRDIDNSKADSILMNNNRLDNGILENNKLDKVNEVEVNDRNELVSELDGSNLQITLQNQDQNEPSLNKQDPNKQSTDIQELNQDSRSSNQDQQQGENQYDQDSLDKQDQVPYIGNTPYQNSMKNVSFQLPEHHNSDNLNNLLTNARDNPNIDMQYSQGEESKSRNNNQQDLNSNAGQNSWNVNDLIFQSQRNHNQLNQRASSNSLTGQAKLDLSFQNTNSEDASKGENQNSQQSSKTFTDQGLQQNQDQHNIEVQNPQTQFAQDNLGFEDNAFTDYQPTQNFDSQKNDVLKDSTVQGSFKPQQYNLSHQTRQQPPNEQQYKDEQSEKLQTQKSQTKYLNSNNSLNSKSSRELSQPLILSSPKYNDQQDNDFVNSIYTQTSRGYNQEVRTSNEVSRTQDGHDLTQNETKAQDMDINEAKQYSDQQQNLARKLSPITQKQSGNLTYHEIFSNMNQNNPNEDQLDSEKVTSSQEQDTISFANQIDPNQIYNNQNKTKDNNNTSYENREQKGYQDHSNEQLDLEPNIYDSIHFNPPKNQTHDSPQILKKTFDNFDSANPSRHGSYQDNLKSPMSENRFVLIGPPNKGQDSNTSKSSGKDIDEQQQKLYNQDQQESLENPYYENLQQKQQQQSNQRQTQNRGKNYFTSQKDTSNISASNSIGLNQTDQQKQYDNDNKYYQQDHQQQDDNTNQFDDQGVDELKSGGNFWATQPQSQQHQNQGQTQNQGNLKRNLFSLQRGSQDPNQQQRQQSYSSQQHRQSEDQNRQNQGYIAGISNKIGKFTQQNTPKGVKSTISQYTQRGRDLYDQQRARFGTSRSEQ